MGSLDVQEPLEGRDLQEPVGLKGLLVSQVLRDLRGPWEPQGHRVLRDRLGLRELPDPVELQGL